MKMKHFRLHSPQKISSITLSLLAICFLIMSFLTGYFVSESIHSMMATSDPHIEDLVRPATARAVPGVQVVSE